MSSAFCSVYTEHLAQYIQLKQQLGFSYQTGAVILGQLDRLAAERGETSVGITSAFAQAWGQKRPHESALYHYDRIRHLIRFSMFLLDVGITSYVPRPPRYPLLTFIPYIYSPSEVQALFQACDELRMGPLQVKSPLISVPALLRLLYSTGLRIGEALALSNQDVNLAESHLRVRDSKNGQERVIPFSDSLVDALKEYLAYRNYLPINQPPTTFFVCLNGKPCKRNSVSYWFKRSRHQAGIPSVARIHDLRYTFAVTSLAAMAEASIDLYASLPVLSRYLGHQSLEATNHYVRLTESLYPDLIRKMDTLCLDIFPPTNYEQAY